MRAKTINEGHNFERNQEPKKAIGMGHGDKISEKNAEKYLVDVYMKYVGSAGGPDMPGFGDWLSENIRELFRGATYGDYPESQAQMDYDDFMSDFTRELNRPLF